MTYKPTEKEIQDHIDSVLEVVNKELPIKYMKGQKEHGGALWLKNVGNEITPELIDFIVYFDTYKRQVDKLVAAADETIYAVELDDPNAVTALKEALKPFHYDMTKGDD